MRWSNANAHARRERENPSSNAKVGAELSSAISTQQKKRIFVVDDEPTIASSLAAILRIHGFLARYFVDPLEALDAAKVEPPDLLISDVVMPQLSGVDLAIRIQRSAQPARCCCFPDKPRRRIYSRQPTSEATIFDCWRSQSTPVTCYPKLSKLTRPIQVQNLSD